MMMMMMKMIFGAIGGMNLAGETEVFGGNLPRRHFVHHKIPHDDQVSNPGPQRWEAMSYGAAVRYTYWAKGCVEPRISVITILVPRSSSPYPRYYND
jgi:hypothetical protein